MDEWMDGWMNSYRRGDVEEVKFSSKLLYAKLKCNMTKRGKRVIMVTL